MTSPSGEARAVTVPPLLSEGGSSFVQKPCSSCGGICGARDFRPDPRASDGLRSQCRYCEGIAERSRYLRRRAADPHGLRARNVTAGQRHRARRLAAQRG